MVVQSAATCRFGQKHSDRFKEPIEYPPAPEVDEIEVYKQERDWELEQMYEKVTDFDEK